MEMGTELGLLSMFNNQFQLVKSIVEYDTKSVMGTFTNKLLIIN